MMDTSKNLDNPIERIKQEYKKLSNTQKRIADFIIESPEIACFLSLNELAEITDVSAVTIGRFSKKLEYNNFPDLKTNLQIYVQSMISPKNVIKQNIRYNNDTINIHNSDIMYEIIENEKGLLNQTYDILNRNSILEAVKVMLTARKIFIVSKGLTIPVAETLLLRLQFLSINAELLKMDNLNLLPRRILDANEQDVFIVFSFPNYTQSIGTVAQSAKYLGSYIITITDKTSSPPACYSDIILLCQSSSLIFYNSMTAVLSLINTMASLLTASLNKELETRKEKISELNNFFKESND